MKTYSLIQTNSRGQIIFHKKNIKGLRKLREVLTQRVRGELTGFAWHEFKRNGRHKFYYNRPVIYCPELETNYFGGFEHRSIKQEIGIID